MSSDNSNITNENTSWQSLSVSRTDRESLNGHKSAILWFTGLSGSGKSTLSNAVEAYLHKHGARTFVLDGDNIRQGLCNDLGFSNEDRTENIRRIGEVSNLMMDAGVICMTAFISPFRKDRRIVREITKSGDFIEILCNADLEVCEKRDPKGLYKKARAGEISDFTGISSPYEVPEHAELIVDTAKQTVEESVAQVIDYLKKSNLI